MGSLYLRLFSLRRHEARRRLAGGLGLGLTVLLAGGLETMATPAVAQDAPKINFRERPRFPADTQRQRRTVTIDGVLGDNEWDPFYTITEGAMKGVFYCNWDEKYLYLAARCDQSASVLFDIDAGGDGFGRGADNIEVVVGTGEGGSPSVVARLLDGSNSKEEPRWNDKALDAKSILTAMKTINGAQIVEIALPKNMGSLMLRPSTTLGLRCEFLSPGAAADYKPTEAYEPHLLVDAKLVEAKSAGAAGINPILTISDTTFVAGFDLFATLELLNQTDQEIKIKALTWTGIGLAYDAVNTLREVAVPSVPAFKRKQYKYRTPLPMNLAVGSYTMQVTAELEGGAVVQSSVSFSIVEPLKVDIGSAPDPVAVVGPTKAAVNVVVYSAVPRGTGYSVELTSLPTGWVLEGGKRRGEEIDRKNATKNTRFTFKLPSTLPAGDYPFEAVVTWRKREWKVKHIARVVRTDAPKPPDEKKP